MSFEIPLSKPCIDPLPRNYFTSTLGRELSAISDVLESGCCAGTCEEVHMFEEEFAEFVGSKYAVATSSCTTALHLACLALGLSWKSRVLVPGFTFPATAFAPMYCGARVDLVDVDTHTYNMDLSNYKPGVVEAVIPVHAFGNPGIVTGKP